MEPEDEQVEPQPIGPVLDGLGLNISLGKEDLISGAVVVLCVVDEDGNERLQQVWTNGLSWITKTGMLYHALDQESV